jgi:hypothetical protein
LQRVDVIELGIIQKDKETLLKPTSELTPEEISEIHARYSFLRPLFVRYQEELLDFLRGLLPNSIEFALKCQREADLGIWRYSGLICGGVALVAVAWAFYQNNK